MCQELQQAIEGRAQDLVDDGKVQAEQKDGDNHYGGRTLHFLARRRGDFLHLRAHIVVKALDALRPRLNRTQLIVARYCVHPRNSATLALRFQILAGAEGFEPPSSVLETDSLTVELTPLNQHLAVSL